MANWKALSRRTIHNVFAFADKHKVNDARLAELLTKANPFPADRLGATGTYQREVAIQLERRKAMVTT